EQRGGAASRAAAAEGAGHERSRAERPADRAGETARRLVPLTEREADRDRAGDGDDEGCERAPERAGRGETDRGAEPDEDPDRVPVAHQGAECRSSTPAAGRSPRA